MNQLYLERLSSSDLLFIVLGIARMISFLRNMSHLCSVQNQLPRHHGLESSLICLHIYCQLQLFFQVIRKQRMSRMALRGQQLLSRLARPLTTENTLETKVWQQTQWWFSFIFFFSLLINYNESSCTFCNTYHFVTSFHPWKWNKVRRSRIHDREYWEHQ